MYQIWFLFDGERKTVASQDIEAARLIWDALKAAGYAPCCKRP